MYKNLQSTNEILLFIRCLTSKVTLLNNKEPQIYKFCLNSVELSYLLCVL